MLHSDHNLKLSTKESMQLAEQVRKDFPYLKVYPDLVYLDSASTVQRPQCVIDAISDYYVRANANAHRGVYRLSDISSACLENARTKVAEFIGADSSEEIVFTRGTTESLNLVANSFVKNQLRSGDVILLSQMEHHANVIPWQQLAKEKNSTIDYISIDEEGRIDLAEAKKSIDKLPSFLSISHISNVLGSINPIEDIIELAHKKDVPVCIDGAQAVGHKKINVKELGCDFYAFSGHKAYGPMGVGVLYINKKWHDKLSPFISGGGMIEEVGSQESTFREMPYLLEAGTQSIADIHGLAEAIKYLERIGIENISNFEAELSNYAFDCLKSISGINIIGPKTHREAPIISFNINGIHPHDLATILDAHQIALRAGHHCTQHTMKRFSLSATVRASFGFYNTFTEIDHLVQSLNSAKKLFLKN